MTTVLSPQRNLTEVIYADGTRVSTLGEPAALPAALAAAPARYKGMGWLRFSAHAVNESLLAVLDAHPGSARKYDNETTDVLVKCEGAGCDWETPITGRQDKRDLGSELYQAHQAAMIEESFTLEPRAVSSEDES